MAHIEKQQRMRARTRKKEVDIQIKTFDAQSQRRPKELDGDR